MNQQLLFNFASAVILLLVALLGAWLPINLSNGAGKQTFTRTTAYHLGNCLSAGVMLSASFCHLLAEPLKGQLVFVGTFPMVPFLAAVGFLITLASDQIVHMVQDSRRGRIDATQYASVRPSSHSGGLTSPPSHQPTLEMTSSIQAFTQPEPALLAPDSYHTVSPKACLHSQSNHSNGIASPILAKTFARPLKKPLMSHPSMQRPLISVASPKSDCHNYREYDIETAEIAQEGIDSTPKAQPITWVTTCNDDEGHGHLDVFLSDQLKLSFATALLLAAALCVHSVLEGMALGAQQNAQAQEDIMIAIAAHKGLAAYALGASVVETGADPRRFWTVCITFSLASPVAIFIGYALSEVSSGRGGDALSALAAGTFLYVAVMEIIPRELTGSKAGAGPWWLRPAKLLSLVAGFAAMSVLAIWA